MFIAYYAYFGMPMGDQDKMFSPHFCCGSCCSTLEGWLLGIRKYMPFAIPRIWREPVHHHDDCYFCMVGITKYIGKGKIEKILFFPSILSSIAPVSRSEDLPIPTSPFLEGTVEPKYISSSEEEYISFDEALSWKPHFPNQPKLNYLVRELGITKYNADLLASRLREWNLLDPSVRYLSTEKGILILYLSTNLRFPILCVTVLMWMAF